MPTIAVNFHGPINHPATTKLRNVLCNVLADRDQQTQERRFNNLVLYMNSVGGQLDDGISLYGLLRNYPIDVTIVNTGLIASVATVIFLAGKTRIAFPNSRFHFHDYEWNYPAAHNQTRLEYMDHTAFLNNARNVTFEILKERTSLTDTDLKEMQLLDVPLNKDAAFAKEKGIVHKVEYFPIGKDTNIVNVDY